jgi:hypothetical protein
MCLNTDRTENKPKFNLTLQLICSRKLQTLGEITEAAKVIASLKDLYAESHVSVAGRIHPGFVPDFPCRRFFLDISDPDNVATVKKTEQVIIAQRVPCLIMTSLLEELILKHELTFVSESDGDDRDDVTPERIRIGCEDGTIFHYFNSIRAPLNAQEELTARAMP